MRVPKQRGALFCGYCPRLSSLHVPDHTLPLDGSRWRDSIYSIDRRAFDATHTTAFDRLGSRRKELGPPFVLAPILVDVEVAECAKQKKYLIDDTYMKLIRLSGHRDTAMRSSAVLECRAGWRGEEKARGVRKKKEEKRKATGSTRLGAPGDSQAAPRQSQHR